jgi:bifunctional enzyme CysN/CysC
MSARDGDNITTRSARTSWFKGPTLLEHLETATPAAANRDGAPFAMPVQWVNRPNLDFRGFAGTIASGTLKRGADIIVLPGARRSSVTRIVTSDSDLEEARAGQAVTLTLADEIDVSRGDVLAATSHGLMPRRSLTARVLWMIDEPLSAGREYIVQHATTTANARVATLHHAIDIETFADQSVEALAMNQIGLVSLTFDKPLIVTRERGDRELGAFILIDRLSNQTAALGVIDLDAAIKPNVVTVAAVTKQTLGDRARLKIGEAGTPQRAVFVRDTALALAFALALGVVAWLISNSVAAGVAVALIDLIGRPLTRVTLRQRKLDPADVNESGSGI